MIADEILKNFPSSDEYSMNGKHMGIAVIFNHKNYSKDQDLTVRKGSTKDKDALKKTLSSFGFDVRTFDDSTSNEVRKRLKEISKEDHHENNCLLVVMMSHGDSGGIIHTYDDEISIEELWKPFLDIQSCPSLVGKPKIFFIQACRGSLVDMGASLEDKPIVGSAGIDMASISSTKKQISYSFDDVLIYFSTSEGYPSFKNEKDGGWFIQSICNVLDNVLSNKTPSDLMSILLKVNREVSFSKQSKTSDVFNACKQMPVIVSMLTKSFILGGQ